MLMLLNNAYFFKLLKRVRFHIFGPNNMSLLVPLETVLTKGIKFPCVFHFVEIQSSFCPHVHNGLEVFN